MRSLINMFGSTEWYSFAASRVWLKIWGRRCAIRKIKSMQPNGTCFLETHGPSHVSMVSQLSNKVTLLVPLAFSYI